MIIRNVFKCSLHVIVCTRMEKIILKYAEEITKTHPMEDLINHNFFPIRFIENARRTLLIRLIDPKNEEVIADIGCESGHIISELFKTSPKLKKVIGIDISRYALNAAKSLARQEGWINSSLFINCNATSIHLPDNSVDTSISSNVLEHLILPQKGFDELIRITKPGGKIILNLPNERRIIKLKCLFFLLGLDKLLSNIRLITPGHLHYPNKDFVKKLCLNRNVTIEKSFSGPKVSLFGLYIYAVIRKSIN